MQVRVKLYATLSRFSNTGPGIPFEIEVPDGTTVGELMNELKLPREEVKLFFVKGRARPIDWPLEPGDEVGIFPLIEEDELADITLDVWLYGALACYGSGTEQGKFANLQMRLPEGSTMADLLAHLKMPTEERGITFINGRLSAMPGLQPDLGHILHHGDRVGLFDLKSMWPFQYRHGAMVTDEMDRALGAEKDHVLRHTYSKE